MGSHWEALGSDWEALGSQRGASVPRGGLTTLWGPFGDGEATESGDRDVLGVTPWPPLPGGHRGWCQLSPGSCGWPACGRGDIAARGCRLSPPCGGTPPASPFLKPAPPPLCIAGAAAANFPPLPIATSGPHLGRGGPGRGAWWRGGFRGGRSCGGPGGSPGARDEGGRCLGDGAGAGTAAKGCGSCAGWHWLGGAGGARGFRVPPPSSRALQRGLAEGIPPSAAGLACWGRDPLTFTWEQGCEQHPEDGLW